MPPLAPERLLSVQGLDGLIDALRREGYTVIGPTVRDQAIVYRPIEGAHDLPRGWADHQEAGTYRLEDRGDERLFAWAVGPDSPRRQLSPPEETLVWITRRDGHLTFDDQPAPEPRHAFLAVRACDLAAMAIQDRVLRDGVHTDAGWIRRRASSFVVAVNCTDPAATCFCASMGTGPQAHDGFDLALTELYDDDGHRFLVEVGSDRGARMLDLTTSSSVEAVDVDLADESIARAAQRMTRHLDPVEARRILADDLEHPQWDDVAARCLSCGNCTLVCPTCFCTAMEDHTGLDPDQATRVRRWDSCFSLDHSYLHGGGPVRADVRSRYRQWLTHKLSTWWDQFDSSGCVGCGRCITWCPVGIDLVAEVAAR